MARERGFDIDRDGFRSRNAPAARTRPRQLERRRQRRHRPGLPATAGKGPHEVPGLRPARRHFESHRPARQSAARRHAAGRHRSRTRSRSNAVLRRNRRPGGRSRQLFDAAHRREGRDRSRHATPPFPASPSTRSAPWPPSASGDELRAEVAVPERSSTQRNHTATHLLHAALRQVLGPHVKQAGSVVEPPRLRFDFSHYAALDPAEIAEIERLVNQQILRNTEVTTNVMATRSGHRHRRHGACSAKNTATEVRVVSIPDFSKELCGGTHVTPHRRHRRLQDRLRKQHFRGRSPHRSHHRRRRRAPVPAIERRAAPHRRTCCASPNPNSSNR